MNNPLKTYKQLNKWQAGEIERLLDQLTVANARERKAFMAGIDAVTSHAPPSRADMSDWDDEQAWHQYRCQDDSDWKMVSEEDAAKIDAAVLGRRTYE